MGSLTSHIELINKEGICETGPTVYSPYPRRLESLIIYECNYKGSTFSSVTFFKVIVSFSEKILSNINVVVLRSVK